MTTQRPARPVRALALVAALALAGCSAQPGTAARINGERISENELQDAVSSFVELSGQETQPQLVLNTLLAHEVFRPLAAEHGYSYSDGQVADMLDEQTAAAGSEPPEDGYPQSFIDLARYIFLYQEIEAAPDGGQILEQFATTMAEADIDVNPRYGELTDQNAIEPVSHEWLAAPETQQ